LELWAKNGLLLQFGRCLLNKVQISPPHVAAWLSRLNVTLFDVRLVPPLGGRTGRNNVVLDFGPLAPLCDNMTSATNRKYTIYCTVIRGGLSHSQG